MDNNGYDSLFYFLSTKEVEGAKEIVVSDNFSRILRHGTLSKKLNERLESLKGDFSDVFEVFLSDYLHSNFDIEHAYQTGMGKDDVDFMCFDGENKWLIEAVSIAESDDQKNNTTYSPDGIGFTSTNAVEDAKRTQSKICEKVFRKGRNCKFPIPTEDTINIIVVDTKGECVFPFGKTDASFIGLFDNRPHPYLGVVHLRERIHAIVFMTDSDSYSKKGMFTSGSVVVNKSLVKTTNIKKLLASIPIRND